MSSTRQAMIERKTSETDIRMHLVIDGSGATAINTGIGMFDHLLTAFGHHGLFDLEITTVGDLHIDEHHTVEDTAIVLGEAFDAALGDRSGITRFADVSLPMDETLANVALDAGGRPYSVLDIAFGAPSMGALGTQMIPHALESFITHARFNVHLSAVGRNDHHIAEAAFKALARATRLACEIDPRRTGIPSTKGTL
ncbi:MAG: imidazoleglycerol-phosphate dehydratase HisB [Actinomycetia bacterium]|nr:imidazoleglycerol-phosphate dehydratase HisB [Actinomycetes bacterium]